MPNYIAALDDKKISVSKISAFLYSKNGKTLIITIILGVIMMATGGPLAVMTGIPMVGTALPLAGVMAMVVPLAMRRVSENRRRESIDSNMPIFLLSLVSSVESGLSLLRAVEDTAERQMGSLTPELKNLRANISWGMPYREAFDLFGKRVGTKLAKRVVMLLQISMDIGGDVTTTLSLIQKHVTDMQNIEKDRKSQLAPYIFTIYISFIVFLAITLILVTQFFTEIETVQNQLRQVAEEKDIGLGMFGAILGVSVSEIAQIMFHMTIIEAIFGGIAAGKIGEGSFIGGIKHLIIMVVLAILAFSFMGEGGGLG